MTLAMKLDEQREIGKFEDKVSSVRKGRKLVSDDVMMSMLSLTRDELDSIYQMIDNHPEMSDCDIADKTFWK